MTIKPLILLIEDNSLTQFFYQELVIAMNYDCKSYSSGEDALKAIEKYSLHPFLILMDIGLPKMSGIECLKAIRQNHPLLDQTPIIAITAHVMPTEMSNYKEKGFSEIVIKPASCALIRQTIQKYSAKDKLC